MLLQMRSIYMVVLCLLVITSTVLNAQEPPSKEDVALMQHLRTLVEALPPERQQEEAIQIFLDNVDEFESKQLQNRVYLSLAGLYKRMGDMENAVVYFEKAGVPGDTNEIGAIARGHLVDTLGEKGAVGKVLQKALEHRDLPGISNAEYAEQTYVAGRELVRSGNAHAGVELGIESARNRPSTETFEYLETLANDANTVSDKSAYLKGIRWLSTNSKEFGQTERFLRNFSHCEEVAGNIGASIRIMESVIEKYPKSPDAPRNLLKLATLNMQARDNEKAKKYLNLVIEGNFSEDVQAMAANALSLLSKQGTTAVEVEMDPRGSPWRVALITLNILIVLVLMVWYLVRKGVTAQD